MMARLQLMLCGAALLLVAAVVGAQVQVVKEDHLKCYKIKDPRPKPANPVTVTLKNQFGTEICEIHHRATLFCAQTVKNDADDPRGTAPGHFLCYPIRKCRGRPFDLRVTDQFGPRVISRLRRNLLCTPTTKDVEIDDFPSTTGQVTITFGTQNETVMLSGPTTVIVSIGNVADTDGNGLEQVQTEIVAMELMGTSTLVGPITVRLRLADEHPGKQSKGEIEEMANNTPGTLDLPPFALTGVANSFFDVFFEIELTSPPAPLTAGMILHNHNPKHMRSTITHKPPNPGETYEDPTVIDLFNDQERKVVGLRVGTARHTPNPRPCGLESGPSGPTCGGACQIPNDVCLWNGFASTCECVPPGADCSKQSPTACSNGLCPGQHQQCQSAPPACRCVP